MIVLTMIVIIIYGSFFLKKTGGSSHLDTVPFINTYSWYDAIGFSVYCYEGIGVVMPVENVTRNKGQFK